MLKDLILLRDEHQLTRYSCCSADSSSNSDTGSSSREITKSPPFLRLLYQENLLAT
nr:MAG TPA: hypothetical protein [Caudoviricetes sp.]